jgi:hypothetical protein
MDNIKVGQTWKSNYPYPSVGYYTVEILEIGYEIIKTRFTASEWEDGHWVDDHTMTISSLVENYHEQK